MRYSAIPATLTLTLLVALSSTAAGSDDWLEDHVPSSKVRLAFLDDGPRDAAVESVVVAAADSPIDSSVLVTDYSSDSLPLAVASNESYCDEDQECFDAACESKPKRAFYGDAEIMALRAHFGEVAVGKVAEKYEMSERLILGVENQWGAGGRVRYWSYDRTTPLLPGNNDSIRFDFDVVDFEGTTRFSSERFDLVMAGGLRWAAVKIDIDAGRSRNDMPGGTIAADLRTLICRDCNNGLQWHAITGARMSIFGGDWEGGQNGLITPTRDDNITVLEISGGIECAKVCRGHVFLARLLFESQNWRSDALGRDTGQDSLSFIGPGLSVGVFY